MRIALLVNVLRLVIAATNDSNVYLCDAARRRTARPAGRPIDPTPAERTNMRINRSLVVSRPIKKAMLRLERASHCLVLFAAAAAAAAEQTKTRNYARRRSDLCAALASSRQRKQSLARSLLGLVRRRALRARLPHDSASIGRILAVVCGAIACNAHLCAESRPQLLWPAMRSCRRKHNATDTRKSGAKVTLQRNATQRNKQEPNSAETTPLDSRIHSPMRMIDEQRLDAALCALHPPMQNAPDRSSRILCETAATRKPSASSPLRRPLGGRLLRILLCVCFQVYASLLPLLVRDQRVSSAD